MYSRCNILSHFLWEITAEYNLYKSHPSVLGKDCGFCGLLDDLLLIVPNKYYLKQPCSKPVHHPTCSELLLMIFKIEQIL